MPLLVSFNPTIAHPYIVSFLRTTSEWTLPLAARHTFSVYFDSLKRLPPTLPTFDILGRLLRDTTTVTAFDSESGDNAGAKTSIGQLVKTEVLGAFIPYAIQWIENAERDQQDGLISDDRAVKGVQHVR